MARPAYRLLHHSLWDLVPIALGLAHFAFVIWLVTAFHSLSWWALVPLALVYAVSLSWSINSISHNQIHNAYFTHRAMNRAFDLLLSVTIGFSQTLYRDIHNRRARMAKPSTRCRSTSAATTASRRTPGPIPS